MNFTHPSFEEENTFTSALQRSENPVGSLGHAHFGQHVDVVPQRQISVGQAIILRNRLSETMPSFLVQRVDFRPRWREKHAFVVSRIDQAEALDEPLSGQALKRGPAELGPADRNQSALTGSVQTLKRPTVANPARCAAARSSPRS